MTTFPMRDSAGTTFAFEIDNVAITPSKAAAVLRSIDGVSDVKPRRIFRRPTDIHVRFRYGGVAFVVWEPYADSNRYWIGPQDDKQEHIEIGVVEAAFNRYSPPMIFRVLGNLLALRLTFKDS